MKKGNKKGKLYIKNFKKYFFMLLIPTIKKLLFTIVFIRIITLTLIFHDYPLVEYPLLNIFLGISGFKKNQMDYEKFAFDFTLMDQIEACPGFFSSKKNTLP